MISAEIEQGSHLYETVQGMRTVKSLALEGRRRKEWDRHVAAAVEARYALGALGNYPQTYVMPLERMIYSGSIIVGAALALAHPDIMPPGVIMAFSMLAGRTAAPLVQLAKLMQELQEVRGAVGEVASVMNLPPEEDRAGTGLRLPIRGQIAFQSVRFRYAVGAPLALEDASFDIHAGTIFGIMGRSGSGKTTITRLLQGLNPNYEGVIKIDGMDLREIELHHLRTSIGVVPQENFLFTRLDPRKHRHRPAERDLRARSSGPRSWRAPRSSSSGCRAATTPISTRPHQSVGRPAPAAGDRPRADHRSAGADPGRGHQRARRRKRGDHQRQSAAHRPRPHDHLRLPPAVDAGARRRHPGDGEGQGLRRRHARRAAGPLRYLQAHVVSAESPRRTDGNAMAQLPFIGSSRAH